MAVAVWDPYATRAIFVYGKCINEVRHDDTKGRKGGQEARKRRRTLSASGVACEQNAR